jgi:penicillin V acylase-like amidase (Ntn superfamily)
MTSSFPSSWRNFPVFKEELMNKRLMSILIHVGILIIFTTPAVYPCTTFVLHQENRLIFGRNLDWFSGTGLVMVNPRNLKKVALVNPSEKPVKWVSKFGSITFNVENYRR